MPSEAIDWILVERLGWHIDQVRNLSEQDYQDYLNYRDGRAKSENSFFTRKPN